MAITTVGYGEICELFWLIFVVVDDLEFFISVYENRAISTLVY